MTVYSRPGVYINELPLAAAPINSAAVANAAGAVIASFAKGPDEVTKVTSWDAFTKRFGGYDIAYPSTFEVASFFKNGGSELYVRRILGSDASYASLSVVVAGSSDVLLGLKAKHKGADGNLIRVQFAPSALVQETGYFDLAVYLEDNTGTNVLVEQFNGIVYNDINSSDYIGSVLQYGSQYITLDSGVVVDYEDTTGPALGVLPFTGATDPEASLNYTSYTGDAHSYTSGQSKDYQNCNLFKEFEVVDQPLVFFLPDVTAKLGGWTASKVVFNVLIDWVETTRNFLVVETAPDLTADSAITAAKDLTASGRAAVYFPHVFIKDPLGKSGNAIRKIGPAGAVVGNYLATDAKYGPYKAPAGLSTSVVDAVALERALSSAELDALNVGKTTTGTVGGTVNAIRNIPGAGIVVMGARTLKQDGTANRYVNMRRSLIYIEKRLNDGLQFALFENNTEDLWARIISNLGVFLNDYRNQGGLRGTTVDESFYIKCDSENNTPTTIAAGEVHVEVGVALEYPTEFVVLNLSQKTA